MPDLEKLVAPSSAPLSIDLSDIRVIVPRMDHTKKFSDILKTRFMRGNKFHGTKYSILLKCSFIEKRFLVFNTFQGEQCLYADCSSGDATTSITMLFCL
jgi:hypothetical protein